jgi:hypothetical protein
MALAYTSACTAQAGAALQVRHVFAYILLPTVDIQTLRWLSQTQPASWQRLPAVPASSSSVQQCHGTVPTAGCELGVRLGASPRAVTASGFPRSSTS